MEITIQNIYTGECVTEVYPEMMGQVSVPVTSETGIFSVEIIVDNHDIYIGELWL